MKSWHRFCDKGDTHDDECNCSQGCSSLAEAEVRYPAAAPAVVVLFSFSRCESERRWEEGGVLGRDCVGDGVVCCLERIIRRRAKAKKRMNVSNVKVMMI